jgi:hypothetical protein
MFAINRNRQSIDDLNQAYTQSTLKRLIFCGIRFVQLQSVAANIEARYIIHSLLHGGINCVYEMNASNVCSELQAWYAWLYG